MGEAQKATVDGTTEIIVYEGKLTELITQKLYLSVPYYTSITRALKSMGCIRQLRRGGGSSPSQWELIREPTPELWAEHDVTRQSKKVSYVTEDDLEEIVTAIEQRIRDINAQVTENTKTIEDIIKVLPDPEEMK